MTNRSVSTQDCAAKLAQAQDRVAVQADCTVAEASSVVSSDRWVTAERRAPVPSLEELEEPARSEHLASQSLHPSAQFAIRRHQRDGSIRRLRSDVHERVVAAPGCMEDRDAVGRAALDTLAGLAFQHHDDRLCDAARVHRRSYLGDEGSGRSGSVPPPAGGTRTDHIGGVDQKQAPDVARTRFRDGRHAGSEVGPVRPARRALSRSRS